jgi:hypothetical protein
LRSNCGLAVCGRECAGEQGVALDRAGIISFLEITFLAAGPASERSRYPINTMWLFRKRPRIQDIVKLPVQKWSPPFRTIAIVDGAAEWWDDRQREELNPDFPSLCPLFHNVCARMPDRWHLGYVSHCGHSHDVDFTDDDDGHYSIGFGSFEDGLMFRLGIVRNAKQEGVRDLLQDLDRVLRDTDGMRYVEWFPGSIFDSGCLIMNYEKLGAPSPTDPIPEIG